MEYVAIVKRSEDNELRHWKYIKKVKMPSGNWKYIYDPGQELSMFKNGYKGSGHVKLEGKSDPNYTLSFKQTDNLLGRLEWSYMLYPELGNMIRDFNVTLTQGKIGRAVASGEKWIFDNLISDKKKTASQRKGNKLFKDANGKTNFKASPKTTSKPKSNTNTNSNSNSNTNHGFSTGRKKNVTGTGKKIKRRGQGLGGGPSR